MKKLICVLVVMLLAVNASAIVWMGTSTAGGAAGGDGTWGDINNWVDNFDASWDLAYPDSSGQSGLPEVGTSSATPASALPSSADIVYVLSAPDDVYATWNTGPRAIDPAYNGGPATVDGSAQAGDLYVGYVTHSGSLDVSSTGTLNVNNLYLDRVAQGSSVTNSGTINVSSDVRIGWQTDNGTGYVVNYATLNVGGNMILDRGHVLYQMSGTANIGGTLDLSEGGAREDVLIYGGTIFADAFSIDPYFQDRLTFAGDGLGRLVLDGDVRADVLDWITPDVNGYMAIQSAVEGTTVGYDYDVTNLGKTTLYLVPEPATMTLLGLGAVALLRRRK